MIELSASIVLYKSDVEQVERVISCLINSGVSFKLYLIDNSPSSSLSVLKTKDSRIEYTFNDCNLGYGAAHNIAIRQSIADEVKYHLVLNPDVYFDENVIKELLKYMDKNSNIGLLMPKVLYPEGDIQHLCKLLPTPVDLILRRLIPFQKWKDKRNYIYELQFSDYDSSMNVPSLSGCFMFLRNDAFRKIGLFDENIFMYLEDVDLVRRLHKKYKTIYYPRVTIVHAFEKGSYKNNKLLYFHIKSAIYYFNKWGWFFDAERKKVNSQCLKALK